METTQGDHPQVPPAKPPDQGDQPNEEVPVSGAHVLNEAISEDTATAKNGVSLPVKPASDSGGDHMGTPGGGPEVIAQDHVGAENHGPGETVPPPDSGSRVRDAPEIEAPRQTSGQSVKKPRQKNERADQCDQRSHPRTTHGEHDGPGPE